MPQKLCAHLEACGVLPLLYGASWLMTCFSADFPASFSARWAHSPVYISFTYCVSMVRQYTLAPPADCFLQDHAVLMSLCSELDLLACSKGLPHKGLKTPCLLVNHLSTACLVWNLHGTRVMDVIMADKMDQALLKAAVCLLKRCEQQLLRLRDMEDILQLLKLQLPSKSTAAAPHPDAPMTVSHYGRVCFKRKTASIYSQVLRHMQCYEAAVHQVFLLYFVHRL